MRKITICNEYKPQDLNFAAGFVYETFRDEEERFCLSCHSGDYYIADCYPCDEYGEIRDGYKCPIPYYSDELKQIIYDTEMAA